MSLYEMWTKTAYDSQGGSDKKFWDIYMPLEQRVYEDVIESGDGVITGTLTDFARRYNMKPEYVCGFLDGIKGALDQDIDVENVTEDYVIDIRLDYEKLFKKMVEYKAKHLYTLSQWDKIFDSEKQARLIDEQKRSGTFVSGEKPGRNDPCPCGSGKKYKKCCGTAS